MAFTKKITRNTKANLLTRQSSLFKRERLVHGSSTTVQNRVQCKENSTRSNENLSISKLIKTAINTAINVKLLKSKVTLIHAKT
jgi:ribonuclease PH